MANYTLTLRQIVENNINIFQDYPIWDEKDRLELENKIVKHYYFREIGVETVGRFIFNLNTRLNEIMPYYIQLYKTTQFEYNPLLNYDMVEKSERQNKSNTSGNSSQSSTSNQSSTTQSNSVNKFSDTPQCRVDLSDNYLTNLTENTDKANSDGTSDTQGESIYSQDNHANETQVLTRQGNIGVMTTQDLIIAERKIIINLMMDIVGELKDLFMQVY